jgi:hypothetical protein
MDAATNGNNGNHGTEEDSNVQLQMAIFEVTRDSQGKDLEDIKDRLRAEFARRGVEPPPPTWLDSVASAAFYGKSYIIDFPAALAADDAVPAPNEEVREQLETRRRLRQEKLPPGILPDPSEWELSPRDVTAGGTPGTAGKDSPGPSLGGRSTGLLLAVAGAAATLALAILAVRASRRGPQGR